MAGKGGFIPGSGRKPGSKNKSTIQRELIAKQVAARTAIDVANGYVNDQNNPQAKLATKVLEEFMMLFAGMAATYQPIPPGMAAPPGREPDETRFRQYAELARDTAKALAPYQSPTFKAVQVTQVGNTNEPDKRPGDDAKIIDLTDVREVTRVYQRIMKASSK